MTPKSDDPAGDWLVRVVVFSSRHTATSRLWAAVQFFFLGSISHINVNSNVFTTNPLRPPSPRSLLGNFSSAALQLNDAQKGFRETWESFSSGFQPLSSSELRLRCCTADGEEEKGCVMSRGEREPESFSSPCRSCWTSTLLTWT